jgi:hypothetical protein
MFMTSVKNTTNKGLTNKLTSNKINSLYIFETLVGEVVAGFTPLDLFQSGEQGVWYDPSDLSTLFQDDAGTTPVVSDGDPVGLMQDKSGNGNDATQSVSASRPTYRTDGTLHWLEFDGVDDYMESLAMTTVTYSLMGVKRNDSSNFISLYDSTNNAYITVTQQGSSSFSIDKNSGSPTYKINNTDLSPLTRNGLHEAVTVGSSVVLEVGNIDSSIWIDTKFGGYGSFQLNGNVYGLLLIDSLLAEEVVDARGYMADKSGVTL